MENINIKKRTLKKSGNGFHFMIPPALIRDTGLLKEGKDYDLMVGDPITIKMLAQFLYLKNNNRLTAENIEQLLEIEKEERLTSVFDGRPNQFYQPFGNLADLET